jgi:hypothetical protein
MLLKNLKINNKPIIIMKKNPILNEFNCNLKIYKNNLKNKLKIQNKLSLNWKKMHPQNQKKILKKYIIKLKKVNKFK